MSSVPADSPTWISRVDPPGAEQPGHLDREPPGDPVGKRAVGRAGVAEPDEGAVRQRADAVEGGDGRQPGDKFLARVVRAGRDHLVDVLDGDRLHRDDHLSLTGYRIREILIARNAPTSCNTAAFIAPP
jgi:hypothetical protein